MIELSLPLLSAIGAKLRHTNRQTLLHITAKVASQNAEATFLSNIMNAAAAAEAEANVSMAPKIAEILRRAMVANKSSGGASQWWLNQLLRVDTDRTHTNTKTKTETKTKLNVKTKRKRKTTTTTTNARLKFRHLLMIMRRFKGILRDIRSFLRERINIVGHSKLGLL